MVDNIPAAGEVTGAAPDGAVVTVVYDRIHREMSRFLRTDNTGETVYSPLALATLVTEILTEHTTSLRHELQAVRLERDEFARLARVREADVLDVIDERDRLAARLDELDTATATAGGR